jgi:hypothetical protein
MKASKHEVGFTKEQQEVLTGTLLGDGCLAQHGHFHRLHIKHKAEHRALAELKYRTFAEYISMPLHAFDQQLLGKEYRVCNLLHWQVPNLQSGTGIFTAADARLCHKTLLVICHHWPSPSGSWTMVPATLQA